MSLFITILIVSLILGTVLAFISEGETFGVGILIFVLGIALALLLSKEETTITTVEHQEIVTLKDNSSMSGDFFLGCGNVEGNMKYTFYYKVDSNSFKLRSIDCNEVELIYSNDPPELMTEVIQSDPNCKRNKWRINFFYTKYKYYIKIPPNSIKTGFILDAQ